MSNSPSPPPPNQLTHQNPFKSASYLRRSLSLSKSSSSRFHPYRINAGTSSKHDSGSIPEILSPALSQNQPGGSTTSKSSDNISSFWLELASVLAKAYGPFRVPVDKISLKKFLRPHSINDIAALADTIIEDDQRSLHPILVEVYPHIISDAQFMSSLSKIKPLDSLSVNLLDKWQTIGFVIHGAKRYQACLQMEDRCIYAKFLRPGKSFLFTVSSISSLPHLKVPLTSIEMSSSHISYMRTCSPIRQHIPPLTSSSLFIDNFLA